MFDRRYDVKTLVVNDSSGGARSVIEMLNASTIVVANSSGHEQNLSPEGSNRHME